MLLSLWICRFEALLLFRRRAERSYSTFKVRRGGSEEIPLVQGKEQQLRFAGTAVKRYPTPKVRETQVRQVLQEGKDGRHTETIRGPQLWLYLAPRLLK